MKLVICTASIAQALQYLSPPKRQHSCWVRGYLCQRPEYDAYNCLIRDLQLHDAVKLKNYLRMDLVLFEELFEKTEESITTKDTKYRYIINQRRGGDGTQRRLSSIRSSVTRPVFVLLVVSLVLSRLDYGNATLAGITDRLMDRLRSVLNASARLIYASRRTEHVTPLLRELHWLRYPDRIDYKLAVLVYRCLHGLAPSYLADEFTRVSEIVSRRNLRSASTVSLVVPRFQRKTLGGRAFPVAAAQAWNSLPLHVTSSSTLASFKRSLKTELFLRSYVQAWYGLMLHVMFLTLLRALEVNIDLRHVNHIRYY